MLGQEASSHTVTSWWSRTMSLVWRQGIGGWSVTAAGYTATNARSGSMVRTRFSMAASVPESELGQLPHAPW